MKPFRILLASAAIVGLSLFVPTQSVLADDPELTIRDAAGFTARYVGQSIPDPVKMSPGETKTVTFRFKNMGTKTWQAGDISLAREVNPISVFTVEPKYRESAFYSPKWVRKDLPATLKNNTAPGQIGEIDLIITAPTEPGSYKEEFHLAAWNYSWVNDGYFWLDIVVSGEAKTVSTVESKKEVVVEKTEPVVEKKETTVDEEVVDAALSADVLAISKTNLRMRGGDKQSLVVIYQNNGEDSWEDIELHVSLPDDDLTFADKSWESDTTILVDDVSVDTDGVSRHKFTLRAPTKKGEYVATIVPKVNGTLLEDASASVAVNVTKNAPSSYKAPRFTQTNDRKDVVIADKPRLSKEPRIRVGLWKPETDVQIRGLEDDMVIFSGTTKIAEAKKGQKITIVGGGSIYYVLVGLKSYNSDEYIRVSPKSNPSAVSEIINYDRVIRAKSTKTYNQYRGAYEVRYDKAGETLWLINDLLKNDYMKGMGENSNISPMEYLKSQAVAQRTYAHYITEHTTKHDKRNFDVVATTGDQLYLGYVSELEMPRFVEAVNATRGQMVGYDTDEDPDTELDIVITPYFGHSNGKTKSWTSVWGGSHKPWLVPVVATYDRDAGRRMFGHGVGMSQLDAAVRADREGLNYEELLKYYYTGVEMVWMYR